MHDNSRGGPGSGVLWMGYRVSGLGYKTGSGVGSSRQLRPWAMGPKAKEWADQEERPQVWGRAAAMVILWYCFESLWAYFGLIWPILSPWGSGKGALKSGPLVLVVFCRCLNCTMPQSWFSVRT